LPWAIAVAGVMLIGAGVLVFQGNDQADEAPLATGGARVSVSPEIVDYGDVKINTPIETVFYVQNVGDQPLRILGEPEVELVEGC
jgi:hypothetical protein